MAKRSVFDPTRQTRLGMIHHVAYEYANLTSACHHSLSGQAPWRTQCDDAFLLGYRKLRDFLLGDPASRYMDDVLAMDYLPPGAARNWELPIWERLWHKQMNRHLTHIAYARVTEQARTWDHTRWLPRLRPEMQAAWSAFLNAITDPDYRAEFDAQLAPHRGKPWFW
jgi:hypothetical protein